MPLPNANDLSLEDFQSLPFGGDLSTVRQLIILPRGGEDTELHYSGYRCMDLVACTQDGAMFRINAYSDLIHIDGIGGMGKDWFTRWRSVPRLVPPTGWSIDCLVKSGLLRLFPSSDVCDGIDLDPMAMSSFEIFGRLKPEHDPYAKKQEAR